MEDIIKDDAEEIMLGETAESAVTAGTAESENDETEAAPVAEETALEAEPHPMGESLSPLEALMKSGLSEREAILVLNDREQRRAVATAPSDSLPRMAHSPRLSISYGELMQMKEIFEGLSDTEINRLYNKVTK